MPVCLRRALSIKLSDDIDDDEIFANTFICALCIAIFVVGVFKFHGGHRVQCPLPLAADIHQLRTSICDQLSACYLPFAWGW